MTDTKSPLSLILFIFISTSLGLNYKIGAGGAPIYVAHLVWLCFMCGIFFLLLAQMIKIKCALYEVLFLCGMFTLLLLSSWLRSLDPAFLFTTETLKYFYTLTLSAAFLVALRYRSVNLTYIAAAIPVGVVISTFTLVESNPFDFARIGLASRLDILALGSFNVYALLVSNALVCLIYLMSISVGNKMTRILIFATIGYLFVVLLSTLSRNGMLCFILGALVYSYCVLDRAKFVLAAASFLAVVSGLVLYFLNTEFGVIAERYVVNAEFMEGSGRIAVWLHLLNLMMKSPSSLFFGFGVGEIDFYVNGSVWGIYSAHNHFLQIFYEFGLIALLGAIFFFYRLIKGLRLIEKTHPKAFLLAVVAQLILNLFLDSTLQASQIGWFFAFWLTFLYVCGSDVIKYSTKSTL
jgi:hypothetical protein